MLPGAAQPGISLTMTPILTFLLQTVVVVCAARATGSLFRRLGQPRVVGEMVAGLMLGPSLLGRVAPQAAEFLFARASLDALNTFSQFGLVLFMFLVGIHLDIGHLRANGRLVLMTSYASMLLPFGLGLALAFGVSGQFGIVGDARLPFVLFVGLSLSITAFPVLVRIVGEHHLASTRLGTVAIACAAFDDVTAWVALALVTSLVHAGGVSITGSLLWLGLYAAIMLTLVRPGLRVLLRRVESGDGRLTVMLVAALASAAATEWLGIHPLFGSFFLGAVMSDEIEDKTIYTARIEPLTVTLFLPLFFAFTGLRTDIYLLMSPWLAAETAIILAAAVLGKAAGPLLIGRRLGFTSREAMALAALLNTRGLVELVVLNIGLESGILPPPLFTMLTLMALMTTAMTSPLLRRLGYSNAVRLKADTT
jgi:Kef-type K+ transport system membrane component KefB